MAWAISLSDVLNWVWQSFVIFVTSTFIFDAVHFQLHRWKFSRWWILRMFAGLHQVHHDFLDKQMRVHPELKRKNLWAHLVPEFVTTMAGTLAFLLVLPGWLIPVLLNALLQTVMFAYRVYEEGEDLNHMQMDRLDGRRGLLWVSQSYHALHHVYPMRFYSSCANVFDLLFGTGNQLRGKVIAVSGATGAFGAALSRQLVREGATVMPVDPRAASRDWLIAADILVLAHGTKGSDSMRVNYTETASLVAAFVATHLGGLVPPEVWGVGSEAELHGDFGVPGMVEYTASKRAMARLARAWWDDPDLTYRHIVPSAFKSRMGWGPVSSDVIAGLAMFWIKRGLRYVPATITGLAYVNYFRFLLQRKEPLAASVGGASTTGV